jgi:hypothetical protein
VDKMSNKEEAKVKEPCQLCLRGPSIDKCRYGAHCKENNYSLFIELGRQEASEDRIDIIGQNGNEGSHYGQLALSSKLMQYLTASDEQKLVVAKQISDGSTASYYQLPAGATELQQLISHRDMNAQIGEIFRACYTAYKPVAYTKSEGGEWLAWPSYWEPLVTDSWLHQEGRGIVSIKMSNGKIWDYKLKSWRK